MPLPLDFLFSRRSQPEGTATESLSEKSVDTSWEISLEKDKMLTKQAEDLVKERIKGTRKGLPDELNYLHSFRVRDMVSACHHWDYPDYDLFIAALLHDIVEDGGVSFEELNDMGFSKRTIDLVRLCSHSIDIKDSTERWMLMIAGLIEAKDEDVWRIKLADLADNLSQSRGLSLESRRFMIEVKAPLLLRLGTVNYSAHYKLKTEMERQHIELAKQFRYIVTEWVATYHYDGMYEDFAVVGDFEDRADAMVCAVTKLESFIRNELDAKTDWKPIVRGDSRAPSSGPNKLNKVVFSKSAVREDAYYDSINVYIEVIEVPHNTAVNERLFNTEDCGYEVWQFFNQPLQTRDNKDALFLLKQDRPKPEQCALWKKEALDNIDLHNAFEVVKIYSEDSHFSRTLMRCKECGQLYLEEFYEQIDWVDGEDPQYVTYVVVRSEEEAEIISKVDLFEFQTFSPRINMASPKGKPRKISWIGR